MLEERRSCKRILCIRQKEQVGRNENVRSEHGTVHGALSHGLLVTGSWR
jgi:hypothetical protein